LEVTCERAELICEIAKQFHLQFDGQMLETVTLSVGVAIFPGNGITSAAILKAADDALYRAKREGRGRVVVAK
jgi:diguanylate cyclase (GGDEF)-like protein